MAPRAHDHRRVVAFRQRRGEHPDVLGGGHVPRRLVAEQALARVRPSTDVGRVRVQRAVEVVELRLLHEQVDPAERHQGRLVDVEPAGEF